jgi:tetratricopeptide (TPR) repeat protein
VARRYFQRALSESREIVHDDDALELLAIRANIALSREDRTEGDKLLAEVADELAHRLGQDHPDTLEIQWLRGSATIEDLQQAVSALLPACRTYEEHAALARSIAQCWTEVGLLRWDLGDHDAAVEALERAVRARRDAPGAAAYLTLFRGAALDSVGAFAAELAAAAPTPDDQWWDRLDRANLMLGLGRARRAAGDLGGARQALEVSIRDLEQIIRSHTVSSYERRLGRARVELAFVLSATGVPWPDRAAATMAAVDWLRRVGGSESELRPLTRSMEGPAR